MPPAFFHPGSVKLGCKPPRLGQTSRCLQFRKYASSSQLPAPPLTQRWDEAVTKAGIAWGMLLNDQLGDCTEACNGHAMTTWAANSGQKVIVTDQDILGAYERACGYVPGDPSTDQGGVIIDVLNDWRKNPIAGNQLGAYVSVNPADHAGVVEAVYLFGALSCGVNLPIAWQNATEWTAPGRAHRFGQWAPGSWGGHCVPVVAYSPQFVYVVSWGTIIPVSWAAVDMYFSEMYALLDALWFSPSSLKSPSGFDLATLQKDLTLVTS